MIKNFPNLILLFMLPAISAAAVQAEVKPDLTISGVGITRDKSGLLMEKIVITVTNGCRGANADASYLLVTFKETGEQGAKAIYYVGNSVKALKGGESYTQTFNLADKKINVGRYIFIEADPYQKVAEASEDNNWRTLFPDGAGIVLNQAQCAAK